MVALLFGGSRSLPASGLLLCAAVAEIAASGVAAWRVGCAAGADSAFGLRFSERAGSRLSVFAAAASQSVPPWVRSARINGAAVFYEAGGDASVPWVARLVRRSEAAAADVDGAWFVLGSPESPGSLRCAGFVARSGRPVRVLCTGFSMSLLPPLAGSPGAWVEEDIFGLPVARWFVPSLF